MTIIYIIIGLLAVIGIFISWCLYPLNYRIMSLNKQLKNLALLGEDWYNEMAEIGFYEKQSTISLIRFCISQKSRKFDIEKMIESDLLKNEK